MESCYELFYDKLNDTFVRIMSHINEELGDEPITLEPNCGLDNMGQRTSTARAHVDKRKVVFSFLSNQMLWYICWCGYKIWKNELHKVDKQDFLTRLHIIDNHNECLEKLTCQNLDSWNNEELGYLFSYATNFIIFHEVGHIVKGHSIFSSDYEIKDLEERRKDEYDADAYAYKAIIEVAKEYGQIEVANLGILCAQCLLLFERKKDEDYENSPHGNPMDRIQGKIAVMDGDKGCYSYLVEVMRQLANDFILEKSGKH